jgi:outer membrane protein assembly factor BamA
MAADLDYSDCTYYDTRDFEPDPTSGYYFEIANEYSGKYIGSQFEFNKLFLQGKGFWKLPFGKGQW